MSREELGERWGHTTLWRGAPAETFREGYISPLRLSKKVCLPLGPLCEGAPPAGGGGENCAVARNISGSDCQKNVFLPCCVCRGDHWSPASLPQQRIFRDSFLQGKWARASNARPYKSVSTVCSCPTFPLPTVPNGCLFLPLDKSG